MTFFKAATMSAPLLEVPAALWAELMARGLHDVPAKQTRKLRSHPRKRR